MKKAVSEQETVRRESLKKLRRWVLIHIQQSYNPVDTTSQSKLNKNYKEGRLQPKLLEEL